MCELCELLCVAFVLVAHRYVHLLCFVFLVRRRNNQLPSCIITSNGSGNGGIRLPPNPQDRENENSE